MKFAAVLAGLVAAVSASQAAAAPGSGLKPGSKIYQIGPYIVLAEAPRPTTADGKPAVVFSYRARMFAAYKPAVVSGTYTADCAADTNPRGTFAFHDADGSEIPVNAASERDHYYRGMLTSTGTFQQHACGRKPFALEVSADAFADPESFWSESQEIGGLDKGPFSKADLRIGAWCIAQKIGGDLPFDWNFMMTALKVQFGNYAVGHAVGAAVGKEPRWLPGIGQDCDSVRSFTLDKM